jgi:mycothiol synthase
MSAETGIQTRDEVAVPGAPDIPGLRFRGFRGESDFAGMVNALNRGNAADRLEVTASIEDIARQYSNLRNSDIARDITIVEVDGQIVGYKRVSWLTELDGTHIYNHFGFLLPEWRGKGIGTALLRHSEARLREIAQGHAGTTGLFDVWAYESQTNLVNILEQEGYKPVRYGYEMERPDLKNIPDIPMPEGLETRPVREEDLRAIWEAEVEAFKDHWGAEEVEEGDFDRWLKQANFRPELWRVGWDTATNEVAGMVRTFINEEENALYNRNRGYTENISVRRPWRRRGLARALMARSFQAQKDEGMTETALGVDAENPSGAVDLYKSMGFEVVLKSASYRKPIR